MTTTVNLKSGLSKGNRRIWIEGAALATEGWSKGDHLYRLVDQVDGSLYLHRTDSPSKTRRHSIAGAADRPILDLTGKWVTAFMGDHPRFTAVITADSITIVPSA